MSRIFAPVDKFPLPIVDMMKIDIKLDDGSILIGAEVELIPRLHGNTIKVNWRSLNIPEISILSWREHKEEIKAASLTTSINKVDINIDWPTESGFRFGSDK